MWVNVWGCACDAHLPRSNQSHSIFLQIYVKQRSFRASFNTLHFSRCFLFFISILFRQSVVAACNHCVDGWDFSSAGNGDVDVVLQLFTTNLYISSVVSCHLVHCTIPRLFSFKKNSVLLLLLLACENRKRANSVWFYSVDLRLLAENLMWICVVWRWRAVRFNAKIQSVYTTMYIKSAEQSYQVEWTNVRQTINDLFMSFT